MRIVKEENGIKVIDFEVIIDSKIYNFVKGLDYIELADVMTFDKNEILNKNKHPDKNTYLRLIFFCRGF